jgi:hypothetical protein
MGTPEQARTQFNSIIQKYGTPCAIQYWTNGSIAYSSSDYDDQLLNAGSSTVVSGGCIIQPIGQGDAQFVEQGVLQRDDVKMFLAGSIAIVSNAQVTIGNTGSIYNIVPDTIQRWDLSGTTIYQVVYLRTRTLTTVPT